MSTPSVYCWRYTQLVVLFCGFRLLLFLYAVDALAGTNSTRSCSSSKFTQCANLGFNYSYPLAGDAACAASASYVLSNCTPPSTHAYWPSFSDAALGVVGSPAVTDFKSLEYEESTANIKLSWNTSLADGGPCPPLFSSTKLSFYNIPSSINLTRFPDDTSALTFTDDNTLLLFNCPDPVAQLGSVNRWRGSPLGGGYSNYCTRYKALCKNLAKTPCIEWPLNTSMNELMLQDILDNLACSHFMFGVSSDIYSYQPLTTFTPSTIGVEWTDTQCMKCTGVYGQCVHGLDFPAKYDHCECSNGTRVDINTQECSPYEYPYPCYGGPLKCKTVAKIGVAAVALVAVLGIWFLIRVGFPRFTKFTIPIIISFLKKVLRMLQSASYKYRRSLDFIDFDGLTERPMEYSYSSIASATKSFSSLVGEGGFGTVYKGTLTQNSSHGGLEQQIAVKVLEAKSKHSKKQFLNEVVTIGKIHHVNVVRLLGFCMQEDHEMLVYEYVVNGSLDRWLFDKKGKPLEHVLDWGQRYAIALGVARGLSYLHEDCRHRTVHCDIKPQNILLDEDMHPKIADFGLARLMGRDESKVVTFAKGTPGYMAPEFWMGGESQLSTKFDVYSYGMVLLELISGQRNFTNVAVASGSAVPAMVFKAAMEGQLESVIDARLGITSDADEAQKKVWWQQIKMAAFVALWCIQDHPAMRPHMSEVVKYLEGGATVSECPPQPTISISCAFCPQQQFYPIGSQNDNECTPLSNGR